MVPNGPQRGPLPNGPVPQAPLPDAFRFSSSINQIFGTGVVCGLSDFISATERLGRVLGNNPALRREAQSVEDHRLQMTQELKNLRGVVESILLLDRRLADPLLNLVPVLDPDRALGIRLVQLIERLDPQERADLVALIDRQPDLPDALKKLVSKIANGNTVLTDADYQALAELLRNYDVLATISKLLLNHGLGSKESQSQIRSSLEKISTLVSGIIETTEKVTRHAVEGLTNSLAAWRGAIGATDTFLHPERVTELSNKTTADLTLALIGAILLDRALAGVEERAQKKIEDEARRVELVRVALNKVQEIVSRYPELLNSSEVLDASQVSLLGDGPSAGALTALVALGEQLRLQRYCHDRRVA